MPEGPQMIFLKEQVSHFVGEHVLKIDGDTPGIPFKLIKGQKLEEIKTFGKEILFCFHTFTIRVHLMFFGKYAIDSTLNRVLRLALTFDNGEINFYACDCKFIDVPLEEIDDWSTDVLKSSFDKAKAFEKVAQKPAQLICDVLLDQHILAGVGNKIKNEVLFRRRVHPQSVVGEIPEQALKKLIDECISVSTEYLGWKQSRTENQHWQVYQKNECPRDHIPLIKEKIGKLKRSCYFCDRCQQLYLADEDL